MNASSTSSKRPKSGYVFQVVVKVGYYYCPVSIVTEQPPDDGSWMDVSPIWVADRARLIYKFLSSEDRATRFRLQTEIDVAIEQNHRYRLWFRQKPKVLCKVPKAVTLEMKDKNMRDAESILYPYTTSGILDCLKTSALVGEGGAISHSPPWPHFWTPVNLRTFIDANSRYTVVVFDITSLNRINYAVMTDSGICRSPKTMREFYANSPLRYEVEKFPAITFFDGIPVSEGWIAQLFLEWENLPQCARVMKQSISTGDRLPQHRISDTFDKYRGTILDAELGRQAVADVFGGDVRLASIGHLYCLGYLKMILSASKVEHVSISSKVLEFGPKRDVRQLISVLARLPNLAMVYITEPPADPKADLAWSLVRSASEQAQFLKLVQGESEKLLEKIDGSSMHCLRLSPLLEDNVRADYVKILQEKAELSLYKRQEPFKSDRLCNLPLEE